MARQGAALGQYSMANHGAPTQRGGLQGMYILKDGAGCQVYRPTWEGKRTIVRLLPVRDPADPSRWCPFRTGPGELEVGDWIRRYTAVTNFGDPGVSFVLADPRDATVNEHALPPWLLHSSIPKAVKSGQAPSIWAKYTSGGEGRGAPIHKPGDIYVAQVILMEHGSKVQTPPRGCLPEHQTVVLLMSQSAGQALLEKINEKDAAGNLLWPDLIDLDGGLYVQFHQAGTQAAASEGGPKRMTDMGGGGGPQANRYEVELLQQYHGIPASISYLAEQVAAKAKAWDDIIRIPSIEEQIRMLAGAVPASALVYALGERYGEMIPESVYAQVQAERQSQPASAAMGSNPMAGMSGAPGGMPGPAAAQAPPTQPANPMAAMAGGAVADPAMPATPGATTVATPAVQTTPQQAAAPPDNPMAAAAQTQQPVSQPAMATPIQPSTPPTNPMAATAPPAGPPANATPTPAQPQQAQQQVQQPEAQQQDGFDPQPQHAEGDRAAVTMEALERARRAREGTTQ